MRRWLADRFQYVRDCGYVQIGPVVITTWKRYRASEHNAFDIGASLGRSGMVPEGSLITDVAGNGRTTTE